MYIISGPFRGVTHYLAAEKVVVLEVCICAFLNWAVGTPFTLPGWVNVKKQKGSIAESSMATSQTATHESFGIESLLLYNPSHMNS